MGASHATVTPPNMTIGPCQVIYDSIDLGGTSGGTKIKWKYEKSPLMADQFGKTILDEAISGMMCQVTTAFLEALNKVNMQKVFPSLILGGTSPNQYLNMTDQTAVRQLAANAAPLELHPLVDASSDYNNEWYFYNAVPSEDSEFDFEPTKQVALKITWNIFLDTTVTPARLWRYGNYQL